MTIETKINIGEHALIYYEGGIRLGVCTAITFKIPKMTYQFDIGDTYANVDETRFENEVFFNIPAAISFMEKMKEMEKKMKEMDMFGL